MSTLPRDPGGCAAGLLFAAVGAAAMLIADGYPMGDARRMGPGYFPWLVGLGLLVIGAVIVVGSWWGSSPTLTRIALRPILIVPAAVVLFALLVERGGLLISAFVTVLAASLARRGPWRPVEAIVLAAGLAVGAVLLFVLGLGLPFRIWPR